MSVTAMVMGSLTTATPRWSVTRSRTVTIPAVGYTVLSFSSAASSNWPSPSRSQAKSRRSSGSGLVEALPSKLTTSGGGPVSGVALAMALGRRYVMRRISPSTVST